LIAEELPLAPALTERMKAWAEEVERLLPQAQTELQSLLEAGYKAFSENELHTAWAKVHTFKRRANRLQPLIPLPEEQVQAVESLLQDIGSLHQANRIYEAGKPEESLGWYERISNRTPWIERRIGALREGRYY